MSLVDVSSSIPDLKRAPGLTTWKVLDQKNQEIAAPEGSQKVYWNDDRKKPMADSMWPNGKEAERHLERW